MGRGRPKGSSNPSAVKAQPQLSVWAQCDNPGCAKWRRLPPGSVVDDSVPWYAHVTGVIPVLGVICIAKSRNMPLDPHQDYAMLISERKCIKVTLRPLLCYSGSAS